MSEELDDLIARFGRWLRDTGFDGGVNSPPVKAHDALLGLRAENERLQEELSKAVEVERDDEGHVLVCTGCGSVETVSFIRSKSAAYFTCCPERKMVRALDTTLRAENELMREALEFYGDPAAWNEPPVQTVNHEIFGKAYQNKASEVRQDRGSKARNALAQVAK